MKIAINTRLLLKDKLEGIGWFTYETLKRMSCQHPEHQFYFIFDRPFDASFIFADNVIPLVIGPPARHPFLFYLWFEFSLPFLFKKIKPDLFVSPDGYLSLRSSVASLAVIHDLNFEHHPLDLPFLMRKYYRYFFPRFARKAQRIVTVSEYSRSDIHEIYQIPLAKIDVVYNGVNAVFWPLNAEEIEQAKQQFSFGVDYFVYVGALHPRKNIVRLLLAFERFKIETQNADFKLVIVGKKMFMNAEMETTFQQMNYKNDVLFVGRQTTDDLHRIIGASVAMTFVPYFEGFGIPILEAMNCDVPVITSNITSMPEIGGDAVLLVDPFSVESIKEAMLKIANSPDLRTFLIEKGRVQRQKFSWQITAEKFWRSIEKCL